MCLAVPMKIIELREEGLLATGEALGVKREISLMLVDDVNLGDWVIAHAGSAIGKIDEEDAKETLALFESSSIEE